jgi:hypothetical protein
MGIANVSPVAEGPVIWHFQSPQWEAAFSSDSGGDQKHKKGQDFSCP